MSRALTETCLVEGCDSPFLARGYCNNHYRRFMKTGDPLGGGKSPAKYGEPQAFMEMASTYQGDECLIWPYSRLSTGHPHFNSKSGTTVASRIVCEMAHGKPENGHQEAAHLCGNGHLGCINRRHLQWKDHLGNMADMVLHGRSTRGEKSASAKLTPSQVSEIRALAGKSSIRKLAPLFGVSYATISRVIRREGWRDTP